MVFAVHVKNGISLSRVREKTQVGLEDKYKSKFEAVDQQDDTAYAKGWSFMMGHCAACESFVEGFVGVGNHCKLDRCDK